MERYKWVTDNWLNCYILMSDLCKGNFGYSQSSLQITIKHLKLLEYFKLGNEFPSQWYGINRTADQGIIPCSIACKLKSLFHEIWDRNSITASLSPFASWTCPPAGWRTDAQSDWVSSSSKSAMESKVTPSSTNLSRSSMLAPFWSRRNALEAWWFMAVADLESWGKICFEETFSIVSGLWDTHNQFMSFDLYSNKSSNGKWWTNNMQQSNNH